MLRLPPEGPVSGHVSLAHAPYGLDDASSAEAVAARRLHGLPERHQADGTLVFALQGRVKLHVIALGLLHERAGEGPRAGRSAHTVIFCCRATGAGHGGTAVAFRLAGSTAVFAV